MATSLKRQMASGIAWTAVQKYSGIVIATIISMILSRLLTPKDFGVVGIATTLCGFFNMFTDFGMGGAVVQMKDLTKSDISSIFSLTIYIGIFLASLFFLASYPIASFYGDPKLISVCQIMCIGLLFTSFNIIPNALLFKEKKFRFIAIRTVIIQIIIGVASIIAALCGAGVYALLIDTIFSGFLIFLVSYHIYKIKFSFKINWDPIKKIASYSLYQFGFMLVNYFSRNLDNILIGKYISLKELGYYQKSYSIMLMPVQNITNVITPALHPILSDYQNNKDFIKEEYNKILKILSALGFPISIILFFCADEIIIILFGGQWTPAITPFRILSITIGFQIIGSTVGAIYQAMNATNWLFLVGILNTITNVVLLFITLTVFKTIESVAWGILISTLISLWNWPYMYHVLFRSTCCSMLTSITPGLIISITLIIVLASISFITKDTNIFLSLALKLTISLIITSYLIQKLDIIDLKKLAKRKSSDQKA